MFCNSPDVCDEKREKAPTGNFTKGRSVACTLFVILDAVCVMPITSNSAFRTIRNSMTDVAHVNFQMWYRGTEVIEKAIDNVSRKPFDDGAKSSR